MGTGEDNRGGDDDVCKDISSHTTNVHNNETNVINLCMIFEWYLRIKLKYLNYEHDGHKSTQRSKYIKNSIQFT